MYNVACQCGPARQYVLRNRERIGKPSRDYLTQFVLQLTVLTLSLDDNSTGDACANVEYREALGRARRTQPYEIFVDTSEVFQREHGWPPQITSTTTDKISMSNMTSEVRKKFPIFSANLYQYMYILIPYQQRSQHDINKYQLIPYLQHSPYDVYNVVCQCGIS